MALRDGIVGVARGTLTLALFAFFGVGALLLAPLMLVLRRPERCQPPVRATWRLFVRVCVRSGLIGIDSSGLRPVRGCILAANHPSLIDVVLLTALVPRTLFVAKHSLSANPLLAAVVRHTALPDNPGLVEAAAPYLAEGWNVLVFPEGTRSPRPGVTGPFRRGVAQLAIRTGAPVACIGIWLSRPILGKGQKPWDMGTSRVRYAFRSDAPVPVYPDSTHPLRTQAEACTRTLACRIGGLMAEAGAMQGKGRSPR